MERIPPDALLEGLTRSHRTIVERLRRVVLDTVPDAIEDVRPRWWNLGYDVPRRRGKPIYFAWIWPEHEHVHLGFQWGVLMDDPERRLQGKGETKQVRWLTFVAGDPVRAAELRPLILEAARVARLSRLDRLARAFEQEDRLGPAITR
jgi:hypothetical protein